MVVNQLKDVREVWSHQRFMAKHTVGLVPRRVVWSVASAFTCCNCGSKQQVTKKGLSRRPSFRVQKPDFVHHPCSQCGKYNKLECV